ncbi:MAG: molybdopterin-binding protein [Peptoniphilus sp.]|uniref:MOSC domain-containing protein n=1 Tax=Peptoniphilus sp. TaxID=1971214 RepID=UPI0025E36CC7|nr:MOSC domain-containing protein [Peptoniphilus sp.]MCI5644075.1 molybdopterin-binding protein [Peptoniphilus sp.]MDD7353119.1 molybdopterin-binding protein [Peptoniphilaceae bacterium]MDY3902695.1 molybdenum cofactor synthesis domain-containing protein [Peptoniphilus sp.]
MPKICALCISEKKGTQKYAKESVEVVKRFGLLNDAHAGNWHRQVSLLSKESVEEFEKTKEGLKIPEGAFGENILIKGLDFDKIKVDTVIVSGDVRLQVTQIGKECHKGCSIRNSVGDCIMPREGVFARVLHGGVLKKGDDISVEFYTPYKLGIITVSDKGSRGERVDESGDEIERIFSEKGFKISARTIIPDDREIISETIKNFTDKLKLNLVLTTGGTGFSPRDNTPEATLDVLEKNVPGIAENMRLYSSKFTDKAMLSRAVSGIRKGSLIINLPGSLKAVRENIKAFEGPLIHGLDILNENVKDCGGK